MTIHISNRPRQPISRWFLFPLLAGAAVAGSPDPADAEPRPAEVRIALSRADLADPRALAQLRRRIASEARTLCDEPGLAGLYRNAARRCRARTVADAERQLRARNAGLLAARGPTGPSTAAE